MQLPRVYADFQNADEQGRLRLNCAGTVQDLARQGVRLYGGLALALYSGDGDEGGGSDELRVGGVVEFSREEQTWVAVVDWSAVRHASDEAGAAGGQDRSTAPRIG